MTIATTLMPALTGSFSSPAGGNPTGAMVEAAYGHHGIAARYVNCDVAAEDLAPAVAGARAMGWIGFNCSLPHKQAVIRLVDDVAPSAATIGAVNCVVDRDGRWIGENTDGRGFVAALREVSDPQGASATILGAGGAARAIAVELALAGATSIHIVNRTLARALEIADLVSGIPGCVATAEDWPGAVRIAPTASILINATSIGLAPHQNAVPHVEWDSVSDELLVCDVIPNPARTRFLQFAEERGVKTLDGRGMLAHQAAINVRLWTGVSPDVGVMRARLDEVIEDWRHGTAGNVRE